MTGLIMTADNVKKGFTLKRMQDEVLRLWRARGTTILLVTHDIDEAIYMSDRIVIMTQRPGRIDRVIPVDLPRPRSYRLLSSKRFLELKQQAIEGVHEEALKAFEAGERELA